MPRPPGVRPIDFGELRRLDPVDAGFGGGMPRAFAMAKGGGPPPELDLEPQPQTVTATVTCPVRLADLAVPGLPGTRTVRHTAVSSLDTFRERS